MIYISGKRKRKVRIRMNHLRTLTEAQNKLRNDPSIKDSVKINDDLLVLMYDKDASKIAELEDYKIYTILSDLGRKIYKTCTLNNLRIELDKIKKLTKKEEYKLEMFILKHI